MALPFARYGHELRDEDSFHLEQGGQRQDRASCALGGRVGRVSTVTRPLIVCLCGSTRFLVEFDEANLQETLRGHIVLTIGSSRRTDDEIFSGLSPNGAQELSARLGALHRAKIDLADEVLVVDPGGYVGASTREEIDYARAQGKPVRFWSAETRQVPHV